MVDRRTFCLTIGAMLLPSRRALPVIKRAGGTPRYTEYEGAGHVIWDRVFAEPELLPWVFAQKRTG